MKHFKDIFRSIFVFIALLPTSTESVVMAVSAKSTYLDSVEVSLVTCSPHEEIYSLYGHTALRWHDMQTGEDLVFNWGVFNFQKPHFVTRFILGLTDYELGVGDFRAFCSYYSRWGSSVIEQVLNLTAEEKKELMTKLRENLKPENKVYRYNFFYDNCATRPRDMIEQSIAGRIAYAQPTKENLSFRAMIHQKTKNHPWARFGNDILLGFRADEKTTREQQEFLPENLLLDFNHASIYSYDGRNRPLVSEQRIAVKPGVQFIEKEFPLTPTECAWLLLGFSLIVLILEIRRRKTYMVWDVLLMTAQAITGTILTVMIVSQHPCTSLNLQILLLNPFPLCFFTSVIKRRKSYWWKLSGCLIAAFFLGSLVQDYAEGMEVLALSLLIRVLSNIKNAKQ